MKPLAVLGVLLGIAMFAASAGAVPTTTAVRGKCGAKALTIYFWPEGHPAIPSIGFPEFRTPHVEVYGGKQLIGFVDATGAGGFAKSCKTAPDLPMKFEGKTHKTISATMLVTCKLSAAAELRVAKSQVMVAAGHTTKEVV